MVERLEFSKWDDNGVKEILKKYRIGLTVEQARKTETVLGRPPTLTEAVVWGIMSSEHISLKSSKALLKSLLPTAPTVLVGPGEDAGIVEIAREGKIRWGLAVSHESHNHPLPFVPFENAVAGLSANVRDTLSMGAKPLANLNVLRFGSLSLKESRKVANESIRGAGRAGTSLGIPTLGTDLRFDDSYNRGGLFNTLSAGLVREDRILHSFASSKASGCDLIVVGKPLSFSGMGGAVFASAERDGEPSAKGFLPEPDPLLMRHLLAASEDLFSALAKTKKMGQIALKDLGAGGVLGAALEMLAPNGLGMEIDLDTVPVSVSTLHPSIIACSEAQERLLWIVPTSLTPMILDHYNRKWDLGSVAEGARASSIGKVTKGGVAILWHKGEKVFEAKVSDVLFQPETLQTPKPRIPTSEEPSPYEVESAMPKPSAGGMNKLFVQLLGSAELASRKPVFDQTDLSVQGNTVVEATEADAGVLSPFAGEPEASPGLRKRGVALSLTGFPRLSKISPYWQAANSVLKALRSVVATGARPVAITDSLNFGNPQKPETLWDISESIRGIAEACHELPLEGNPKTSIPVIGGNVSFYNLGDPLAAIGCVGTLRDSSKALTLQLKEAGDRLYLLGDRKNELGGSALYHHLGLSGAHVPQPDFKEASSQMEAVLEAADSGLLRSVHAISSGGLLIALATMAMPNDRTGGGNLGIKVELEKSGARSVLPYQKAFSETGGFVVELHPDQEQAFLRVCGKNRLDPILLGEVTQDPTFEVSNGGELFVVQFLDELKRAWQDGLAKALRLM